MCATTSRSQVPIRLRRCSTTRATGAANIRKPRKPEPYKGKGVRYAGEHVRRKAGKAGK